MNKDFNYNYWQNDFVMQFNTQIQEAIQEYQHNTQDNATQCNS